MQVQLLAEKIAQPPSDPRFAVQWEAGSEWRVKVTAIDGQQYLNGRDITLQIADPQTGAAEEMRIPQTAPGLYELARPASRNSVFCTVKEEGHLLGKFSMAARYAPEFEAIGNNRQTLQSLADRTGGGVIEPGTSNKIDFHWPGRRTDLTSLFAVGGFMMIAGGLIINRRAIPG